MKWICFSCESCGVGFAIPTLDLPEDVSCPGCGDDFNVTATGECMNDPDIVFDRD